jgi:AraC-like DNA-binding protein
MIVGCLTDRVGRARIDDGAKGVEPTVWLDSFQAVLRMVCERPTDVSAVVVGWIDADGVSPAHVITELRRAFPAVPVLGYCLSSAERLDDLRRMAVAGVHQLLLDTTSDSRSVVRQALETTRRQCAATQVFAQIQDIIPPKLQPLVSMALENPARTTSVSALARELGVDRKTLHNWCKAEKFLSPRDLLRWSRLLLAASLLNWSRRSVTSVAIELEYPTDNSLRIAIRRQFRVQPSEMKRGGVDRAVGAFRAHVARFRQPTRTIAIVA